MAVAEESVSLRKGCRCRTNNVTSLHCSSSPLCSCKVNQFCEAFTRSTLILCIVCLCLLPCCFDPAADVNLLRMPLPAIAHHHCHIVPSQSKVLSATLHSLECKCAIIQVGIRLYHNLLVCNCCSCCHPPLSSLSPSLAALPQRLTNNLAATNAMGLTHQSGPNAHCCYWTNTRRACAGGTKIGVTVLTCYAESANGMHL